MASTELAPGQSGQHHRSLLLLILVLIVTGLSLAAWRYAVEPEAPAALGDRLWDLEIAIQSEATANETSIEIALPLDTRFLRTVGQQISHPGWKQSFRHKNASGRASKIVLMATEEGSLTVNALFSVHASATPHLGRGAENKPLDTATRDKYLQDHPMLLITHASLLGLVEQLQLELPSDTLLPDLIYQRVRQLRPHPGEDLLEVPDILARGVANERERAYTMVALCRAAKIPTRLVKGFILKESPRAKAHFWVEVFQDDRWQPYDPVYGYQKAVPPEYLPVARGPSEVVTFHGTSAYSVEYAISNADPLLEVTETTHQDWREMLDLTRLPLDARQMLAALMLLPFGVLLTAAICEPTGIRAYGVFTPTLLATSLVYIPWPSALMVFGVVLTLGVVGRSAMPSELPRVPRLSIVLTLVALGVGASASLMEYLEMSSGGELILLPLVILASLVDRFYSVFDDDGWQTAMVRLGWTVALAISCLPIVQYEALGHAMTRFPELHLLTLAAILALSLYRGKRLAQTASFAWLNWPQKPGREKRTRKPRS